MTFAVTASWKSRKLPINKKRDDALNFIGSIVTTAAVPGQVARRLELTQESMVRYRAKLEQPYTCHQFGPFKSRKVGSGQHPSIVASPAAALLTRTPMKIAVLDPLRGQEGPEIGLGVEAVDGGSGLRHRAREPRIASSHSNCVQRSQGAYMPSTTLSDKAVAVFAFAAYHQLASGEPVVDVVLQDGAGHAADPRAVEELVAGGFVTTNGDRAAFSETGKSKLSAMVAALRSA